VSQYNDANFGLLGNQTITNTLLKGLRNGTLVQSYVLIGPPHLGKLTLAQGLAQGVNCLGSQNEIPCGQCSQCMRIKQGIHPDVQIINIKNPEITEDSGLTPNRLAWLRGLLRETYLKPFEGKCRVFILEEVDTISRASADTLLKSLEEPPSAVLFILIGNLAEHIPDTILSCCQRFDFRPLSNDAIEDCLKEMKLMDEPKARELAILSEGCIGWAIEAANNLEILDQYLADRQNFAMVLNEDLQKKFSYAEQIASRFWKDKEYVLGQLAIMLSFWRTLLLFLGNGNKNICSTEMSLFTEAAKSIDMYQVMSSIKKTENIIEYLSDINNPNPRLAFESLMLDIHSGSIIF